MAVMCNRPGCIAEALDGHQACAVHLSQLQRARQCLFCHGTGWYAKDMPCATCGGIGLRDKHTSAPRVGKDRRTQKVDRRGLITASEVEP